LEYAGRADGQVKVRGYRIELGEVEAALRAAASVRECAVVATGEGAERRLVGYVVRAQGVAGNEAGSTASSRTENEAESAASKVADSQTSSTAHSAAGSTAEGSAAEGAASQEAGAEWMRSLREGLRERLPEYMVPGVLVELAALPLTPNGKVNRKALTERAGDEGGASGRERVRAGGRTELERSVCRVWGEVLGVEEVGVEENFFELGGHSLLAARATARVSEVCGVEMGLRAMFEHPTVAKFAVAVVQKQAEQVNDDEELLRVLADIESLGEDAVAAVLGEHGQAGEQVEETCNPGD
jgi:hypothetical protein